MKKIQNKVQNKEKVNWVGTYWHGDFNDSSANVGMSPLLAVILRKELKLLGKNWQQCQKKTNRMYLNRCFHTKI